MKTAGDTIIILVPQSEAKRITEELLKHAQKAKP